MAIAVGQTSKGHTGSATTITTTGVNTSASGSAFVVGAIWNTGANFSAISDNMGNSANYLLIGSELLFGASNDKARLYYVPGGTGGSAHTATFQISVAKAITCFFVEITGGDTTSGILDQNNARSDTASPYTLAAGLTTVQAAELLLSMLAGSSGSNPATHAESGLGSSTIQSAAEEVDGTAFWTGGMATSIKSATGTFNPSWTETGGATDGVFLATFKEAAAGGTTNRIKYPYGMDGTGGGLTGQNRIH